MIGRGASADLPALVGDAARVAIIHQAPLAEDAQRLASTLGASKVTLVEVPTGEQAKTSTVLAHCWDSLADAGFTRSDLVVGVGGGTTTDLAGFVAATWLRGVHYISVPTSVLAMVEITCEVLSPPCRRPSLDHRRRLPRHPQRRTASRRAGRRAQ